MYKVKGRIKWGERRRLREEGRGGGEAGGRGVGHWVHVFGVNVAPLMSETLMLLPAYL